MGAVLTPARGTMGAGPFFPFGHFHKITHRLAAESLAFFVADDARLPSAGSATAGFRSGFHLALAPGQVRRELLADGGLPFSGFAQ
jgi:hypothetical protein